MSSPSATAGDGAREPAEPPDERDGQHRNTWKLVAAFVGLVVLILALGSLVIGPGGGVLFGSTALSDAESECADALDSASATREFSADDRTLHLRTGGMDRPALDPVGCVLRGLGVPEPLVTDITSSTPADSRQTTEFDGVRISWEVIAGDGEESSPALEVELNS